MEIAGSAIVGKVFGAAASGAFYLLKKKRLDVAREVIQRELEKGKVWAIADDEAAAALFTYLRCAEEGVARLNLEMIAEAFVNGAQDLSFAPDEFRRLAGKLADLSREEILVLAVLMKEQRREVDPSGNPVIGQFFWKGVVDSLLLNTAIFPNHATILGHCSALTRTGWLAGSTGWDAEGYIPTPQIYPVEQLVEWRRAAQVAETG